MNDDCVLGIAYRSTFGAVKIFDSYLGLTDLGESFALAHELSRTHIYSNSWGPLDTGDIFEGPGVLGKEALTRAMQEGRNGLGPIYTWAAGNGGLYDDCNCDGYASSIYTISVTAIGHDQGLSWYSEECSSIMIGTYSGDSPDLTIVTTDTSGGCTDRFQGTSASCPIAAAIIALALEANPSLTWRDIQHLIVETSTSDGLINANWHTNGAGYKVSHTFGFGILNADGMVEAALSWQNVPSQVVCESETKSVYRESTNGVYVIDEHESNGCAGSVLYVEHVEVVMTFHATYRGSLQIMLVSPSGTRSRLLRPRRFDTFNGATDWTFMTVHNWGELASGTWMIQLETSDSTTDFGLDTWKLILYGTESAPANNPQAQVSREPVCDENGNTGTILGGVLGGAALLAVTAALVYVFVIRKPFKDPTVFPDVPARTND